MGNSTVNDILLPALRQYSHNNNKGELIFGYDKPTIDKIVCLLIQKIEKLEYDNSGLYAAAESLQSTVYGLLD